MKNNNKIIRFDKKNRQQIVAVELVNSLFCGMKTNDLHPKSKTCLFAILNRCQKVKDCLFLGNDRPVLAVKDYNKHQRIFTALRKFVLESYGEQVSLDYYNAVMMLAFDVAETVKGDPEYVEHWQKIAAMMETVYIHMEGQGEHNHYITLGMQIKYRLERLVEAA